MSVTRNSDTFAVVLVTAVAVLSQVQFGFARSRRASGSEGAISHENVEYSQSFKWFSAVLDQYGASPESMDLREKESDEVWESCHIPREVNYSDPLTQAMFIRRAPAFYTYALSKIIAETPILTNLFREKPLLNIVAIGTGPGTEMAVVVNYLVDRHGGPPPPMLRFLLVDYVPSWTFAIDQLEKAIKRDELKDEPESGDSGLPESNAIVLPYFEKMFYEWDVLGRNEGRPAINLLPTVRTGDLFIFDRVYANILCTFQPNSSKSEAALSAAVQNLRQIVQGAPDGALFLFVDNSRRWEEFLAFVEPNVFSPENSVRVVENPMGIVDLPWNSKIEEYYGKFLTPSSHKLEHKPHFFVIYQKVQKGRKN